MPFVPTTGSRMIAAIVPAPSTMIVSRRCCSARSVSSSGVDEKNAERYGYGPQKCTMPGIDGSEAQRRGSPVIAIERVRRAVVAAVHREDLVPAGVQPGHAAARSRSPLRRRW